MGSTDGSSDEEPVHSVVIPGFEMMETEVTNRQYETCVNAGVCTPPDTSAHCNWNVSGREHHPVNCISWQQAVDFCTWIGGRLPSESEWEYAARSGGQDIIYPWGDDEADCDYAVMRDWQGDGCGNDRTWEVCSKSNGNTDQGLCDMSGNVFEWTQDRYHGSYDCDANPAAEYCELGGVAPDDGSAWESNNTSPYRIRRGGWYGATENSVRAAYRGVGHPGAQAYSTGVRCAR
jgi:formylglycine-generating enzyme required for sulfatase activity